MPRLPAPTMTTLRLRVSPRILMTSSFRSATTYPTPRTPNSPKYARSLRICAELRPNFSASFWEETVLTPALWRSSRQRRYTDRRWAVRSEIAAPVRRGPGTLCLDSQTHGNRSGRAPGSQGGARRSGAAPVALLPDDPELGDRLQVAHPAGRLLDADERVEIEAEQSESERLELDRMGPKVVVTPSSRDLPQQVEISEIRLEDEIESPANRLCVPREWQSGRSATKVRTMPPERRHQTPVVLRAARVQDIEILRGAGRGVERRRHSAHDDELDTVPCQEAQQPPEFHHFAVLLRGRRAEPFSSSMSFIQLSRASSRSSKLNLSLRRMSVLSMSFSYAAMTGSGRSGPGAYPAAVSRTSTPRQAGRISYFPRRMRRKNGQR